MKEEEAKTKVCPMFSNSVRESVVFTKNCIGSECMMWKQLYTSPPFGYSEKIESQGYCGLAGKP